MANNSSSSSSEMILNIEQLSSIGRYLNIYLGLFMLCTGFLGSCMNLWLFTRHGFRKSPCSRFVIASSIFDIIHLISALFLRVLADGFRIDPASTTVIGCRIRYYLITFSAYASLGCRCLASFDRYACTSRSISFRRWSSFRSAYQFLMINILIWACFAIPNLFFFNLVLSPTKQRVCFISEKVYHDYFAFFVNPVLYFALPLIIFICLAVQTHRNLRMLSKSKRIKRLERQMTSMIILQAVMNSISSVPYGIQVLYSVMTYKVTKSQYRLAQEHLFLQIARLSYYVNFISAFYIFYISSSRIRATIRRHFKTKKKVNVKKNFTLLNVSGFQLSENSVTRNNSNSTSR